MSFISNLFGGGNKKTANSGALAASPGNLPINMPKVAAPVTAMLAPKAGPRTQTKYAGLGITDDEINTFKKKLLGQ